ncbi:ChaN family lipoprotein [Diaphorobacter aerolatus]|uniref:ChaN family lipoprotein n=1 Tax=Diaphorobacter aerolatus TaxID=1288495 RepID=A0A7H0GP74_9BURK|nr:ChaN family lipoprotein [Diaphorobacter aerolatus]QNP50090.1 ChaN family lipoprotein [Diaphorobacter aerolatus]
MASILQRTPKASKGIAALVCALLLAGCATAPHQPSPRVPELRLFDSPSAEVRWREQLAHLKSADVLMLGEQHDAAEHHEWEAQTVRELAARGRLAAVVLEMADAGTSTRGLAATASETQVRELLSWNDEGWPWKSYGPVVMAAVRADVPVIGGNLPLGKMRATMQETRFDTHLNAEAMQIQMDAIKIGHCDLLPESRLLPMARIQLARDESMANAVQSAVKPGKTVLLIAGHGHVRRSVGVAQWLAPSLTVRAAIAQTGEVNDALKNEADMFIITPAVPPKDHCAELRQHFKR